MDRSVVLCFGRREPGARVTPGARSLEPANARFPFGHPSASSSARGFALTAVGTLALTTAATIAVFAVVNAVLVRALPFASPTAWSGSAR